MSGRVSEREGFLGKNRGDWRTGVGGTVACESGDCSAPSVVPPTAPPPCARRSPLSHLSSGCRRGAGVGRSAGELTRPWDVSLVQTRALLPCFRGKADASMLETMIS